MFSSMNSTLFSTKEKEVQAEVVDICSNGLIVSYNNKEMLVTWEDLTIYKKQLDTVDQNKFSKMIGQTITFLMIKKGKELQLSRSSYMKDQLNKIRVGDTVIATVTSAGNGALYMVLPNGLEGKIYAKELTSSKIRQPLDIYNIGDNIKCKVTRIREDGYVDLSRIELYKGNSFEVKRGEYVRCKITKRLDDNSGYFVELVLNPLYSGIFDINRDTIKNYKVGQEVDLKVLDVDDKKHLKLRAV